MSEQKNTKMDPKLKATWVAALRSGDYEQGTGALCLLTDVGSEYCCLGVLAEIVFGESAWVLTELGDLKINGCTGYYAGPNSECTGHEFAHKNDGLKWDFNAIADYIEENL